LAFDLNTASVFIILLRVRLLIVIILVVIFIVPAVDLGAEEVAVIGIGIGRSRSGSGFFWVEGSRRRRGRRGRRLIRTRHLGQKAEHLEELAAQGGVITAAMVEGRRESEGGDGERLDEAEFALVADDVRLTS